MLGVLIFGLGADGALMFLFGVGAFGASIDGAPLCIGIFLIMLLIFLSAAFATASFSCLAILISSTEASDVIKLRIYDTKFDLITPSATNSPDAQTIINIARDCLYVKNPLVADAELMTRVKGWQVPRYLPRLLLMARPGNVSYETGYYDIPLGLISVVKDYMIKYKIQAKAEIIIEDKSKLAIKVSDSGSLKKDYVKDQKLRDYQNAVVEKLSNFKRAQAVSMTGSGKTIIMSGLIKHFNMPTIILCHRNLLINQWKSAIEYIIGRKAYTLVGGKVTKGDCKILIASFQSIGSFSDKNEKALLTKYHRDYLTNYNTAILPALSDNNLKQDKLDALKAAGLDITAFKNTMVIVDEAHVAPAFGFYTIISSLTPTLIYGCTATPNRADGRTMYSQALFSNKAVMTDPEEVKKHLTPLHYVTVNITAMMDTNLEKLTSPNAIMDSELTKILVSDIRRFSIVVYAIKQVALHGYTAVVICGNNLWLVDALADAMEYNNIAYGVITGSTKDEDRKDIISKIESRELKILLATTTIDVGVDITSLDAAILPVPFSGETVTIQRAGRIVRKAPGKNKCMIIDFKDCLIPKAVGAYTRRKRHVIKTFDVFKIDIIADCLSENSGLDPEWTRIIQLKEST